MAKVTLVNQADFAGTYGTENQPVTFASNEVSTTIIRGLTAVKTADQTYWVNGPLTYQVKITNNSGDTFTKGVLTDDLRHRPRRVQYRIRGEDRQLTYVKFYVFERRPFGNSSGYGGRCDNHRFVSGYASTLKKSIIIIARCLACGRICEKPKQYRTEYWHHFGSFAHVNSQTASAGIRITWACACGAEQKKFRNFTKPFLPFPKRAFRNLPGYFRFIISRLVKKVGQNAQKQSLHFRPDDLRNCGRRGPNALSYEHGDAERLCFSPPPKRASAPSKDAEDECIGCETEAYKYHSPPLVRVSVTSICQSGSARGTTLFP